MNLTWPDASSPSPWSKSPLLQSYESHPAGRLLLSPWSKSPLLQSYESHLAGRLPPLSLEQNPIATEL